MRQRVLIINIVLFIVASVAGIWLYLSINEGVVSTVKDSSSKHEMLKIDQDIAQTEPFGIDSDLIVKQDLFNPKRTQLIDDKEKHKQETTVVQTVEAQSPPLPPPPPPPPPVPELTGIMIISNDRFAYMLDSVTNTEKAYRVNEMISGYIISKIESKQITLLYRDNAVIVPLKFKNERNK